MHFPSQGHDAPWPPFRTTSSAAFFHAFPPNGAWRDSSSEFHLGMALMWSRSYHPTGVRAGFGHGRCVLVAGRVDLHVWRKWATRSRGNAVSSDPSCG